MQITVQTLTTKQLVFDVHCDDTVRSIKERVAEKEGHPYRVVRLLCDGKVPDDDDRTLRECNVTDGSLIFLIIHTKISMCLHENILVNVATPSGDTIALQASRGATVSTIKAIVWSELNARAVAPNEDAFSCSPVLFYEGIVIEDGCVLEDISAPRDRVLQLLVSPSHSGWSLHLMRSPPNFRTPHVLGRPLPPNFRRLDILGQPLGTTGCQRLADALLLNTSITSLNFHCSQVGAAGASVLFPALAHLPSLTLLCLSGTQLQSAGALHLCSALPHLTALTELDVGYNELAADDAARICSAAASAGLTRLKVLDVSGNAAAAPSLIRQCSLSALTTLQELRFNGMSKLFFEVGIWFSDDAIFVF